MQNSADFKLLCHEWFHHVRHHAYAGHSIIQFGTIVRGLDCFSVSFPGDVRGEPGLRELVSVSQRTRLRNGQVTD